MCYTLKALVLTLIFIWAVMLIWIFSLEKGYSPQSETYGTTYFIRLDAYIFFSNILKQKHSNWIFIIIIFRLIFLVVSIYSLDTKSYTIIYELLCLG